MNDKFIKGLFKISTYVNAYTLGAYTYASSHGNPVELYRWIITIATFMLFYYMSKD